VLFHCSVCQDTFIVDNGDAGIWVWCGRKSNPKEKKEAMANATVSIPRDKKAITIEYIY